MWTRVYDAHIVRKCTSVAQDITMCHNSFAEVW